MCQKQQDGDHPKWMSRAIWPRQNHLNHFAISDAASGETAGISTEIFGLGSLLPEATVPAILHFRSPALTGSRLHFTQKAKGGASRASKKLRIDVRKPSAALM
jgi:hypothetical protein